MVPSYGGIELLDDESSMASGAAFNLDRASRSDGSVTVGGLHHEVRRNGRVVVARGGTDSAYEGALDSALRHVQEALDLWSFDGVDDLAITRVDEDHVVWWPTAAGLTVRVVSIAPFGMRIRAQGVVADASGKRVPPSPQPARQWHPSFRYFRLSQASSDLFDAYRNAYLALESLLSSVAPQKPGEHDTAWFRRALGTVAGTISLSGLAPQANDNSVESIIQDLYAGTRSGTFHAKAGRAVLLPRDAHSQATVVASLERLVRLYLALAEAHLGVHRPGSSLSSEAFRASSLAILSDMVIWASDDERPFDPADTAVNPRDGVAVQLPAAEAANAGVPFVMTKLAAGTAADLGSLPFVRRVTGASPGGMRTLTNVLEERLVLGSTTRLEVVFGVRYRNEGPRVDYPT